jgi:predicted nucleotidyltransferase
MDRSAAGAALSEQTISRIVAVLRAHGERYALVFGSGARGALGFDSDLDVAVSADRTLSSAQRYDLIGALALATGRPIDLVDLRAARGAVFAKALQGRELFCDSVRAKADALYRRVTLIEEDLEVSRRTFATAHARMFR